MSTFVLVFIWLAMSRLHTKVFIYCIAFNYRNASNFYYYFITAYFWPIPYSLVQPDHYLSPSIATTSVITVVTHLSYISFIILMLWNFFFINSNRVNLVVLSSTHFIDQEITHEGRTHSPTVPRQMNMGWTKDFFLVGSYTVC